MTGESQLFCLIREEEEEEEGEETGDTHIHICANFRTQRQGDDDFTPLERLDGEELSQPVIITITADMFASRHAALRRDILQDGIESGRRAAKRRGREEQTHAGQQGPKDTHFWCGVVWKFSFFFFFLLSSSSSSSSKR